MTPPKPTRNTTRKAPAKRGAKSKTQGRPRESTKAQRAEIIALAKEGVGRNEISRRTGLSTGIVSRTVAEHPDVAFIGGPGEEQRAALEQSLAGRRLHLAAEAYRVAEEQLELLDAGYEAINWYQGELRRETFDKPTVEARTKILTSFGIAVDKALALAPDPEEVASKGAISLFVEMMKDRLVEHEAAKKPPAKKKPATKKAAPK